jgi:superfamily II DNA helicase RecQ
MFPVFAQSYIDFSRLTHNCRPLQREVITATLEGEDVFLQAATSFGKSLCYQLPAVVDFGSTSVRITIYQHSNSDQ